MTDCDKHCQYITDKIRINIRKPRAVETEIRSLERIPQNKIDKSNELYQEYMNLLTDRQVCMDDCRRRNHDNERGSTSGSQDIPVDPALIAEFAGLDSDNDDYDGDNDGGKGGRCGSRRRSIHNKIRRKTKRLRRRGLGRKQTRNRRGRSRRYKK